MSKNFDIAIVGGGLNGLTLSIALRSEGFDVAVIDASKDLPVRGEFNGRAYAMALTSQRMLQVLGVWDAVADLAEPMLDIKVSDGRAGEGASPFFMHFDHHEIEEGPMGFMVEDRDLRPALVERAQAQGVEIFVGTSVVQQDVKTGHVDVALSDTTRLSAGVLVGCDGTFSGVAKRAKIGRTQWGYDQTAIVCAVEHELPHNGVAHQFFMPSGPLAILPLTQNRSSIVWTEASDVAAHIMQLDDAGFLDALMPAFGSFLGEVSLAGKRGSFPLRLSVAQDLTADRVALVGDAAHGIHPIAGQGLNAGMRDIAALAEVLGQARRRGEDIGNSLVLDRYAAWRRFDVSALALATDAFNRLYSNDNPGLRTLRDVGMGIVQNLPGLKKRFIREAAGLSGDLPRLMRGLPLQ